MILNIAYLLFSYSVFQVQKILGRLPNSKSENDLLGTYKVYIFYKSFFYTNDPYITNITRKVESYRPV